MITENDFHKSIYRLNQLSAEAEPGSKSEKNKLKAEYRLFIKRIETDFHDNRHNFINWLRRESWSFRHPETGNVIDIYIGDDAEAIYYFLRFCYLLDIGKQVDDGFTEYLTYLIARSNTQEEC